MKKLTARTIYGSFRNVPPESVLYFYPYRRRVDFAMEEKHLAATADQFLHVSKELLDAPVHEFAFDEETGCLFFLMAEGVEI